MSYSLPRRSFLNWLGIVASTSTGVPAMLKAFGTVIGGTGNARQNSGANVKTGVKIQVPMDASPIEKLAAKEAARYLYLRTGALPTIDFSDSQPKGHVVVIAQKDWPRIRTSARVSQVASELGPQQFVIKSEIAKGDKLVWIVGGDQAGVLYGTYKFLEKFGIRFYLHQDVVPEGKVELLLPDADESGTPVFELRGLNPWGSHSEGIDLWDADEYKAVMTQMTKMRMNIILLHSYPPFEPYIGYEQPTAEPGVWVGLPQDVDQNGHVRFSNTASYWNTARSGCWGYLPKKTGDYHFGGSLLFETDEWGPAVMNGNFPYAKTVEGRNDLYNRVGEMYREAFSFARELGMKTGIGTEGAPPTPWQAVIEKKPDEKLNLRQYGPPIQISTEIQQHLRELGKDPQDPAVIEEVYEGIFQRIMKMYPLDYYMIFTQECWYWTGFCQEMFDVLVDEWKLALRAWEKVKAPFGLASCGWILGPEFDHAALDKALPEHVALSTQSRAYNAPIDEAYARINRHSKWAMPWIEEDSSNAVPEMWAARLRFAAADALAYGCNGLIPVMWQTMVNEPRATAVAEAGWTQAGWNPEYGKPHPLPPPSTLHVEGPVSFKCDVEGVGWTPTATATGSIIESEEIFGTEDGPLYRTYWSGLTGYRLRVPKGTYRVTLKFIEPLYCADGERVFDVALQHNTVLTSLDIFALAGRFKALDRSFENVQVTDGWLQIDFFAKSHEPLLCGIVVTSDGYRRQVNCGAEGYRDYVGDKPKWVPAPRLLWGRGTPAGCVETIYEPSGLPVDDLYADWAIANFGPEIGREAGELFAALDGEFPLISRWTGVNGGGAGGFAPDDRPWEYVRTESDFLDRFEKLRPMTRGPANQVRFDFWLNHFREIRKTSHAKCVWSRLENELKQTRLEEDETRRRKLAAEVVLPLYQKMVSLVGEAYGFSLASVSDWGGIGRVVNWEGHNNLMGIEKMGREIADLLGQPLPASAVAPKDYQGNPRVIVPTVRTLLNTGEALRLKVIILDNQPARSATLYWRQLGIGEFRSQALDHNGRGVYRVTLPLIETDFEYYIAAKTEEGKKLVWPITAPETNQTVVIWDMPHHERRTS